MPWKIGRSKHIHWYRNSTDDTSACGCARNPLREMDYPVFELMCATCKRLESKAAQDYLAAHGNPYANADGWGYAVVHTSDGQYGIYEVDWHVNGSVISRTKEPVGGTYDNLEDLRKGVHAIAAALGAPLVEEH